MGGKVVVIVVEGFSIASCSSFNADSSSVEGLNGTKVDVGWKGVKTEVVGRKGLARGVDGPPAFVAILRCYGPVICK